MNGLEFVHLQTDPLFFVWLGAGCLLAGLAGELYHQAVKRLAKRQARRWARHA